MEPLAIVGFSFRFPQDATSSERFWLMMNEKRCAAAHVPGDRFNVDAYCHSSSERTDTVTLQEAHFMEEDMGAFDAPFFSISPAEAAAMDPQQRGMLETCYHALENAGIPLESVAGSKTAVYTGCFSDDHRILSVKDPERLSKYAGTGTELSLLANRLSWWFDLRGPSFNLDNACASSLTAFHLACQSLWTRESSMALVGGSNLMSSIEQFLLLSNLSMLSARGRSFSFDHRADGYGRGEGYGILVIKTLSDALRDDDCIRAVVRATGANQDGRTPSLTSPSQTAQEALIRETYGRAGLDVQTTAYVEAHGTGTAVGDPIEARALGAVLGAGRSADRPLYIGTVKSNIGHLEGASGIASIIKTILALERAVIPPNANFEKLNPAIDAGALNLAFPQKPTPWPKEGQRRASINSFGFGGSNCHVVLDDAYNYLKSRGLAGHHQSAGQSAIELPACASTVSDSIPPWLLAWSASDSNAVSRMVHAHAQHFAEVPDRTRSALPTKNFALIKSPHDLCNLPNSISKPVRKRKALGLAYLFTGQGAQYSQMGIFLCIYPAFRASLASSNQCLSAMGCEWNLLDELAKTEPISRIHEPEYSQTVCTVLQIALVDLLRSFGVVPQKVVGHSSGEIAAAYAIGALSLASAVKVAFFRGKASGKLAQKPGIRGAMLAVGLSEAQVANYLTRYRKENHLDELIIACVNSPKSVTLAGDEIAISMLETQLNEDGAFTRKLKVNVAYHSPHMTMVSQEYRQFLDDLVTDTQDSRIEGTMISSVTGWPVEANELTTANYWVKNMESPVRFCDAVSQLLASQDGRSGRRGLGKISDMLEIGPHAVLQGPVMDILKNLHQEAERRYDSVLKRRSKGMDTMLNALGRLHCLGYPVDLLEVNMLSGIRRESARVLTDLPSYPFDHSISYWHESQRGRDFRFRKEARLDLLGLPIGDSGPAELGQKWRKITRILETPWVQDHVINDTNIYPAAGMLCMAFEAIRQIADPAKRIAAYGIKDVDFLTALPLSHEAEGTESQFYIQPLSTSADDEDILMAEFKLCTLFDGAWVENCRGTVQVQYGDDEPPNSTLVLSNIETCTRKVDPNTMYDKLHAMGMQFGPMFQCMDNIHVGQRKDASADINAFQWLENPQDHVIHPVTLDSIFHPTLIALIESTERNSRTAVPTKLRNLWLSGAGINHPSTSKVQVYAKVEELSSRAMTASLHGINTDGKIMVSISSLEVTFVDDGNRNDVDVDLEYMCYNIYWKADIDLLDSHSAATYCQSRAASIHPQESADYTNKILGSLMELIAFKRPGLKLLEIAAGDVQSTENVLQNTVIRSADGQTMSAISRYDVTHHSPPLLGEVQKRFRDETAAMNFLVFDMKQSAVDQGFETNNYDVVIAPCGALATSNIALADIRKLLKRNGKLIMLNALMDELSRLPLHQNGFSETGVAILANHHAVNQRTGLVVLTAADDSPLEIAWPDVVVVINDEAPKDDQMADMMCQELYHLGCSSVEIASIRDVSKLDLRDKFCICLAELSGPVLGYLDESTYLTLRSWLSTAGGLLWVRDHGNNNPIFHMITGVTRVCRSENPNAKYVTLAVDNTAPFSDLVSNTLLIFQKTIASSIEDIELEYEEIDGYISVNRAVPAIHIDEHIRRSQAREEACSRSIVELPPLKLEFPVPGSLQGMTMVPDVAFEKPLQPHEIEIEIKAFSLNTSSFLTSLGRIDAQSSFMGCSGIVAKAGPDSDLSVGQAVFGLSRGNVGTFTREHFHLFAPMQVDDDFEKAAAMAVPLVIAHVAMFQNAGLQEGEVVLIENGADICGHTAIQLAQHLGATIAVTIEDESERQTLLSTYKIPAERIFLNRDVARISSTYLQLPTKVDVLIGSSSKRYPASNFIAPFGRIVHIDANNASSLACLPRVKSVSLTRLNVSDIICYRPGHIRSALEAISFLSGGQTINPAASIKVHAISKISEALCEIGAVSSMHQQVVQISPNSVVQATLPTLSSYNFPSNATYVLAGGFGGIGPNICRWMACRGAKNFIILSRSGPHSPVAKALLEDLCAQNVRVEHPKCDVSSREQVEVALRQSAGHLPPIKGCIQASLVLQDSVFETMTYKEWTTAISPRIQGTLNLHALLPPAMDFFILLSSINGILGARFQANYAASNTFLDAFAHMHCNQRIASIDMGWYAGTLASNDFLKGRFDGLGCVYQVPDDQLLGLLDYYCSPERRLGQESCQTMLGVAPPSYARAHGKTHPELLKRPLWRVMNALDTAPSPLEPLKISQRKSLPLSSLLASMESDAEAAELICNTVTQKLASQLGIEEKIIDKEKPVHVAGVDSLMAVELRTWFKKEIGINVSVFEIMGNKSLQGLCAKVVEKREVVKLTGR